MYHMPLIQLSMLCGLLLVSACTRTEPPSAVERRGDGTSSPAAEKNHTVKEGETTLAIAKMYDMREDELVRLNNIRPPFKLTPGQKLRIKPNSKNKPTEPAFERVQEEKEIEVTPLNMAENGTMGATDLVKAANATSAVTGATGAIAGQTSSQPFSAPEGSPILTPTSTSGWQAPLTKGDILYRFGDKLPNGTVSDGVTWKAPAGTPVVSASNGTVLKAGQEVPAYGNMVVIKGSDGKLSVYAHMKQIDKSVKVNSAVQKGQTIGQVGQTGQVNEPQLHFQVRNGDAKRTAVDPLSLMS